MNLRQQISAAPTRKLEVLDLAAEKQSGCAALKDQVLLPRCYANRQAVQ
jgi:hypothetical protein